MKTQRYLSLEDIDEYRQQRLFYSQAGITATQTMERWGGHEISVIIPHFFVRIPQNLVNLLVSRL